MSSDEGLQERISTLIYQHQKNGQTREEAFSDMCKELDYKQLDEEDIQEYFRRFDTGSSTYLEKEHDDLLEFIGEAYKEFNGKFAEFEKTVFSHARLLNDRYSLGIKFHEPKLFHFVLCDIFHGEVRKLQCDFEFENEFDGENLVQFVIDLEHLFFIKYSSTESSKFSILLLKLNFNESKVTCVDQQIVDGRYIRLVQDHNDRTTFLLMVEREGHEEIHAHLGRVHESKIVLDKQHQLVDEIDYHYEYFAFKLENNHLKSMQADSSSECETNLYFCELHLDGKSTKYERLNDIEEDEAFYDSGSREFVGAPYVWSDTKCYLNDDGQICVFDEEERTLKHSKFNCDQNCEEIRIDSNVLSIYAKNNEKCVFRRFIVNKPDSLQNICWFYIRRQSLLFGSKLYENLMQKLPNNLRPFGYFINSSPCSVTQPDASTSVDEPDLKRCKNIGS